MKPPAKLQINARDYPREYIEQVAEREGAEAAEYLLHIGHAHMLKYGRIQYKIERSATLPLWFAVAVIALRKQLGYAVEERKTDTHEFYVIRKHYATNDHRTN